MSTLEGYVEGMLEFTGGGGGGSDVTITPTLSEGTKIADYSIDDVEGSLYAPTPIEPIVYSAGANIQISEQNVISATDTTYTAGDGIDITGGVISATGGSSSGVEIVELYSGNTAISSVLLNESFRNFDIIMIISGHASGYSVSASYITDTLSNGDRIGYSDDVAFQWWTVTDNTHLDLQASGGNYYLKAVYGIQRKPTEV